MIRRALITLALALTLLPFGAFAKTVKEKGKFDLMLNGVNKGYEKYKVILNPKDGLWTVSSEVRFQLPWPKAKRNYVDLYIYPVLNLAMDTRKLDSYSYRMTWNDFSKSEMVEAQDSATEFIDQDTRNYDLMNRTEQIQNDEMADRVDLGVNAGRLTVNGQTLSFRQTRFSDSRIKDEPLPGDLAVLDAYVFCLYIPLAHQALAMKDSSEPLSVAFPQGMRLRQGTLQFMGIEKTPFHGQIIILRHYDVNVGDGTLSSFWVDKAGKLVQVAIPSEGLMAVLASYKPQAFDREEPRILKEAVIATGAFTEHAVRIPSGSISLGATLTLPAEKGTFPTVLMVSDLQALDRDGNEPGNPYSRAGTWKQVAYLLASQGYATLRYDARGVGESGGDQDKATWSDRIGDVVALSAWLKQQPTTKGGLVLLAHGLGAWVAAEAAPKVQPSAFVAVAYPAKSLMRLWREQVNSISDPQGRLKAQMDLETLTGKLDEPGAETATYGGRKVYLAEIREMASKDPVALAGALTMPCLFAYPERDQTVMAFHKEVLAPTLHAGQEAIVLPNLGHRLTPLDSEGGATGLVEQKSLKPVLDWLKKVMG